MKTINRLIAAALVLFAAAACYNKEIESPDDSHNPQTSDFRITASIIQTRVTYSDSDENLNQQWEVNDIVFGFIEDDNSTSVVLKVTEIDVNGIAKLVPTTGGDALSAMDENTYVNLIYTGGNPLTLLDNSYTVDMSSQSGKIPACLHASAKKSNDALEFHFVNDCAIFEIVSLTGVAEDHGSDPQDLMSITVSNVFTSGKYTFGENGSVSFDGVSGQVGDVTITLGEDWTIDGSGTIKYKSVAQPVLIAVAPKTADENAGITITAEADNNIDYGYDFGPKSIVATKCYVVSAKPIVAKTEDGLYFTTVTGAFAHAKDLSGNSSYDSADENIVTLLKDCGLAGIDANGESVVGESAPIDIEGYDVTLDLNGHTLELGTDDENIWDCFQVENTSTFTIKDSEGNGKISSSAEYMIKNSGSVNIINGNFTMEGENSMVLNNNGGLLTITGGTLYSDFCSVVENHGILNVEGGEISSVGRPTIENLSGGEANIFAGTTISCEDYEVVTNKGNLTIKGGTLTSDAVDEVAITSLDGELKIDGDCTITSTAYLAIDVPGGEFTMSDGYVSGKAGGIQLTDGSTGTITGGTIESTGQGEDENIYALYVKNSTCKISGGTIINNNTTKPAIFCFTDENNVVDLDEGSPNLLITWPEGGESAGGPLIVSSAAASDGKSFGAVSTANAIDENTLEEKTNYAIVEISGGYLYSSDGAFCSKAGNSTLSITGPFYTNIGVQEEDNPVKSQYYDFSIGNYVFVPSENVSTITCGEKKFAFMISPEWTYVIDNCSQTKTAIGADEEVTYSFRSYKQKGTEKEPVPWKAQMFVGSNAGNGWRDNHDYGNDGEQLHWITNIDDGGFVDRGLGSIDDPEEYTITFKSTKSDTYTVKIIALDNEIEIASHVFAPVVQTISSTPSTDPTVTELWSDGPTTSVTISSSNFDNINLEVGDSLWIYYKLKESTTPNNASIRMWVSDWSYQQINFNGTDYKEAEDVVDQYYWYLSIDQELINSLKGGADLGISCDYGANITKVELIQ